MNRGLKNTGLSTQAYKTISTLNTIVYGIVAPSFAWRQSRMLKKQIKIFHIRVYTNRFCIAFFVVAFQVHERERMKRFSCEGFSDSFKNWPSWVYVLRFTLCFKLQGTAAACCGIYKKILHKNSWQDTWLRIAQSKPLGCARVQNTESKGQTTLAEVSMCKMVKCTRTIFNFLHTRLYITKCSIVVPPVSMPGCWPEKFLVKCGMLVWGPAVV